jgi:hypothetical protein
MHGMDDDTIHKPEKNTPKQNSSTAPKKNQISEEKCSLLSYPDAKRDE